MHTPTCYIAVSSFPPQHTEALFGKLLYTARISRIPTHTLLLRNLDVFKMQVSSSRTELLALTLPNHSFARGYS